MSFTVRVRDFQSIEDATLLVDGLTVITGTNNTGKSAFFRALRGVFTNTRGHSFVRHGATHCVVDVEFDEGQVVQWEKGPKINRYKVGTMPFSKVGHGPPAEVRALGVEALMVAEQAIWPQIAPQISGVQFLLDQPAPILAEALSDVEKVNHINRALRACEVDRKQARSDLRAHEEMEASLIVTRGQFDTLDNDLVTLQELECEHAELSGLMQQIRERENLLQRMQASKSLIEDLRGLELLEIPSSDEVAGVQQLHQAVLTVAELAQRLGKAKQTASQYQDMADLDKLQREIQTIPLKDLEEQATWISQIEREKLRLAQRREELATCERGIATLQVQHEEAVHAVHVALGTFSECPTCGSRVSA